LHSLFSYYAYIFNSDTLITDQHHLDFDSILFSPCSLAPFAAQSPFPHFFWLRNLNEFISVVCTIRKQNKKQKKSKMIKNQPKTKSINIFKLLFPNSIC